MVQVEGLDRLLKEHPFFKDFDAEGLAILAGCASNERFSAGQYIFREGGGADRFYIIRHGSVAVEIQIPGRDRLIIQTLHEDDILGWSWMLSPHRWSYDARALTLVRAVSLDATCLRGKCDVNHELGYHLMQRIILVMAERLAAMQLQLADLYAPSPTQDSVQGRPTLVNSG